MVTVRPLHAADSIVELTALLHRAYTKLGAMGLNYTAVDQPPETTAKRVQGGACFVATANESLVGTIVVQPTQTDNLCGYSTKPGVSAAHQFAIEPGRQGKGIGGKLHYCS